MAKARSYCFTHFEKEMQNLKEISEIDCEYILIGREICPKTQREHKQGFIRFKNPVGFRTVQKRLSNYKIHVEICKGSIDENIEYCTKDGDFEERGERPKQGRRADIDAM